MPRNDRRGHVHVEQATRAYISSTPLPGEPMEDEEEVGDDVPPQVNIVDLQEIAGHSDPRTTLTYIRNRERLSHCPAYVLKY
jgi:hypothetical protein